MTFSQFMDANRGMTPEQACVAYGIDLGQARQALAMLKSLIGA